MKTFQTLPARRGRSNEHTHTTAAASVALVVASAVLLIGCERHELDRRLEELCRRDGGIRVYEKVKLPASMFGQNGEPFPGWRNRPDPEKLGHGFRLVFSTETIKAGDPMKGEGLIRRFAWSIVRTSDGKVVGQSIEYGRSGGDFLAVGHFSSRTCPEKLGAPVALLKSVFQ